MEKEICGIPYDKLMLVRVQGGFDGDRLDDAGCLVLNRSGSNRADAMNSVHFTINTVVKNHVFGTQFDGSSCVIIAPLMRAVKEAKWMPSGLSPGDTWIHADERGELKLPGAQLLAPEGFPVPKSFEGKVTRYPAGATSEENMLNRNEAIKSIFDERQSPLLRPITGGGARSLFWTVEVPGQDPCFVPGQYDAFASFAKEQFPENDVGVYLLHQNSLEGKFSDGKKHADSTSQRIKFYGAAAARKTSFGDLKPRDLRGRSLRRRSTLATSAEVIVEKSVPFGKKSRIRPLVFSFRPRSQA